MKRLVRLCTVFALSLPLSAQTNLISGVITEDSVWSGTNLLQGMVLIETNATVSITPGTLMLMDSAAQLRVRGAIQAAGTVSEPIRFTRHAPGERWAGIRLLRARPSRFEHCIFEYADSEGSHLDYYDNDCNPATPPRPRTYHEAIVALASDTTFENCTFQNLPDSTGSREGDALAIISDDPEFPGEARAHIESCRFLSIGQGIHSRFSYLLVENSFFTDHHGDNDDIDMYGESVPPPLIRFNTFLNPEHDDAINPTRCSAIIVGNILSGGDDHGIVLRDKCAPLVMNNVIANFASAGIAVQNQCDARIINNTIVNSTRGIRFFDHDQRWGPPYCLFPGSGKAEIINTLIWNCPTPLHLADSPYPQDRGSHATILYSNVGGGQASASLSANSTLNWGEGNTNINPQFTSDFLLQLTSPLIDHGTDPSAWISNLVMHLALDARRLARPLDGDNNGTAAYDIGAYEVLLPAADSNRDGIPDGWLHQYGFNPLDSDAPHSNPDLDAHTTFQEWIAGTNPTNAQSFFRIEPTRDGSIQFPSVTNRVYTLQYSQLLPGTWLPVSDLEVTGTGSNLVLIPPLPQSNAFYRVQITLP